MTPNFILQLAATAIQAPSADNSLPFGLSWNGQELSIAHVPRHPAYNVFKADSHATLMTVGAVMEYVQAALRTHDLPAEWRWNGVLPGQPYASVAISRLQPQFARPPELWQRHTNRLPYRSQALPPTLAGELDGLHESSNRLLLLQDRARKSALVRLVRICSEARFCNRSLHTWLFGSLRHTQQQVERGDGLDIRTLGLPLGGRQMLAVISSWKRLSVLNRLGAYKLLALSEVGLIAAAPGLLCVVGRRGEREAAAAGSLLARVWCQLNQQGVAVQPYYVVTDQINRLSDGTLAAGFDVRIAQAERHLHALLSLGPDEMLHMILRAGYPENDPVRSRRLPLEMVFQDDSGG